MKRVLFVTALLAFVFGLTPGGYALNLGTDLYVPAAARVTGSNVDWKSDLNIFNPGNQGASVEIYWLPRATDNSAAQPVSFTIGPQQTLSLPNVIETTFGTTGGGAFRIVSSAQVLVQARIYNTIADGSTFGQGLEGVPADAATKAGNGTDITGLANTGTAGHPGTFRSNIFAVNTSTSATTLTFTLLDTQGATLATQQKTLPPRASFYENVGAFYGGSFDDATLHVDVTSGSAIIIASKNDNGYSDGTTLESWWPLGASSGPSDGTYQAGLYDSLGFATGGALTISGGQVTALDMSYLNFDKDEDGDGQPDCTWTFSFGSGMPSPLPLSAFTSGETFSESYPADASSGFSGGTIQWTVTFTSNGRQGFNGTVAATGSGFSGDDAGCNGTFPVQSFRAGVQ